MADTGNTSTITFGTSGFTANFHMIGSFEQERPVVKTSHLGTSNRETYIPGDLYEPGSFECEFEYDPDEQPPIGGAAETITITHPVPSGSSNGATAAGSGFISKWSSAELKNNELMVGKCTVQFDGITGPTFSDAT